MNTETSAILLFAFVRDTFEQQDTQGGSNGNLVPSGVEGAWKRGRNDA